MDPVAITGLLVAAIRARETKRPDRLFDDPFAEALAGDPGQAALALYYGSAKDGSVPIIEVRTRWYDDAIARAAADGVRQFVILAAGMDARAYRLSWPAGARVFEIDRPEVIAHKAHTLADAAPRCTRIAIGADLAGDWPTLLLTHGFDRSARTVWLVEGLLQYLDRPAVEAVFARLDANSAPRSIALYDVIGETMLNAPQLVATKKMMAELGAPWRFGSDEPAGLLARWRCDINDTAVVGNALKRWPFPAAPANIPGIPRGYFVEAHKD